MDAGFTLDGCLGFPGGARRVFQEVIFQRGVMSGEFVGLALPGETADAFQAAGGELVEVALHAAPRDIGEAGDVFVGEALALEPQDFHLLLDAWMRVMVALVADGVEVFGSKDEAAHGDFLCS